MKKLIKLLSLVLVLTFALTLVACSSYGKLEEAFTKKGYTVSESFDVILNDLKEDADKKDIAVTPHLLVKASGINTDTILILEFKATDEMKEFVENSNQAQAIIKDVSTDQNAKDFYEALENAGYVNGNCLVLSTNPLNRAEVIEIVKNA